MNYSIPLNKTNLTIWRVTLPLIKTYDKSEHGLSEALHDFNLITGGLAPTEAEVEDDDGDTDWVLAVESSCNIIDNGSGANLLNDALLVFRECGADTDEAWDGESSWEKILEKGQLSESVDDSDIKQAIENCGLAIVIDLASLTLAGSLEEIEQFIEKDYLYQLVDDVENGITVRELLPLPWDFVLTTLGIDENG
jgi:hypothetical protein